MAYACVFLLSESERLPLKDVVVIRATTSDESQKIAEQLSSALTNSGFHKSQLVIIGDESFKIEMLDEDQMRSHGWVRVER